MIRPRIDLDMPRPSTPFGNIYTPHSLNIPQRHSLLHAEKVVGSVAMGGDLKASFAHETPAKYSTTVVTHNAPCTPTGLLPLGQRQSGLTGDRIAVSVTTYASFEEDPSTNTFTSVLAREDEKPFGFFIPNRPTTFPVGKPKPTIRKFTAVTTLEDGAPVTHYFVTNGTKTKRQTRKWTPRTPNQRMPIVPIIHLLEKHPEKFMKLR